MSEQHKQFPLQERLDSLWVQIEKSKQRREQKQNGLHATFDESEELEDEKQKLPDNETHAITPHIENIEQSNYGPDTKRSDDDPVQEWLASLDLLTYEPIFRMNKFNVEKIKHLKKKDLDGLGIKIGHRKLILDNSHLIKNFIRKKKIHWSLTDPLPEKELNEELPVNGADINHFKLVDNSVMGLLSGKNAEDAANQFWNNPFEAQDWDNTNNSLMIDSGWRKTDDLMTTQDNNLAEHEVKSTPHIAEGAGTQKKCTGENEEYGKASHGDSDTIVEEDGQSSMHSKTETFETISSNQELASEDVGQSFVEGRYIEQVVSCNVSVPSIVTESYEQDISEKQSVQQLKSEDLPITFKDESSTILDSSSPNMQSAGETPETASTTHFANGCTSLSNDYTDQSIKEVQKEEKKIISQPTESNNVETIASKIDYQSKTNIGFDASKKKIIQQQVQSIACCFSCYKNIDPATLIQKEHNKYCSTACLEKHDKLLKERREKFQSRIKTHCAAA